MIANATRGADNMTTTEHMSMTAAISNSWASISGSGTSWQVTAPYYADRPHGPSTSINCSSYAQARARATSNRAYQAIMLMGGDENLAYNYSERSGSMRDRVRMAAKAMASCGEDE